ncbi:MAG: hypothetical protein QM831_32120 [Kofleriaceae bacterium]
MLALLLTTSACATDNDDPDDLTDDVSSHSDLAAIEAQMVIPDDATTFDSVDTDDVFDEDDTAAVAREPLLKWGLSPRASNALRAAGITSGRIMQTIGNASASAGTHLQDGVVGGVPYCAATDISVSGLSDTEIRNLLEKLGKVGFAAWYRHNGFDHWVGVNHIHAVYANLKMKSSLRSQIFSWFENRNGLISNAIYQFHHFSQAAHDVVEARFARSAHGTTNAGTGSSCVVGGFYCGGDKITGNSNDLYKCTSGAPELVKACSNGCRVNAGTDDSCK